MKSYKLPILGIGLMLLMASCKKEDVRQPISKDSTSGASSKTQWSSLSAWGNSTTENATTYFSKLTDSSTENAETQVWLDFSKDCKYLEVNEYEDFKSRNDEIGKIIWHMIENPDKFI